MTRDTGASESIVKEPLAVDCLYRLPWSKLVRILRRLLAPDVADVVEIEQELRRRQRL